MNYITTEWSMLWIVACVALSLVMSYVLYNKGVFKSASNIRRLLFSMRFITLFILSFLLLKPYINQFITLKERPIILIGVDNSSSLLATADSSYYKSEFLSDINSLKSELEEDFQIEMYAFGEKVRRNPQIDFSDRKTNLSEYMNEISDIYSNRNVVANLLVSDGVFNSGSNPMYANYAFNAPLFIISLGDTILKKDLKIANVSYNELAYLDNTFPVEATVISQFCKGEKLEVSIWEDEVLLTKKEKIVEQDEAVLSFDFRLNAQTAGIHNYRVELTPLNGEINRINNQQNIFVDVLESKQKILLLTTISHPDIAAVSNAIKSNKNYELVVQKISEFDGDFSTYSLVIAFQTNISKSDLPTLYFLGSKSQDLALDWIDFKPSKASLNEVLSDLNPFSLFTLDDKWKNWINELPPVYSPLAEYSYNLEHHTLFSQNIVGVSTDNPIITFSQQNGIRQAVYAAEGLWKWRLYEYSKTNEHVLFDELINKTVQFLAVKEDKRPFRLRHDRLIYENESLIFEADLYNASYELVNAPEVNLLISNEKGQEYNFSFNKNALNYFLEIKQLMVGNYSYSANVNLNGKLLTRKGKFSILPLELEKTQTQANPQVLNALSQKFGGKTFNSQEFSVLKKELEAIESLSLSYTEESHNDLINLKVIFILLFVFLTIEWFIRKRITNI